jgi:hypothetical protein
LRGGRGELLLMNETLLHPRPVRKRPLGLSRRCEGAGYGDSICAIVAERSEGARTGHRCTPFAIGLQPRGWLVGSCSTRSIGGDFSLAGICTVPRLAQRDTTANSAM